jgi:DNA-binding PadR family transcriptional regulator
MTSTKSQAADFLPLKYTWLEVLLAVAGGHRHGYAIRKDVERRTDGGLTLWPTSLYRTVNGLLESGLLEDDPSGDSLHSDRNQRFYQLTALGQEVLAAEVARLESLVRAARGLEGLSRAGAGRS